MDSTIPKNVHSVSLPAIAMGKKHAKDEHKTPKKQKGARDAEKKHKKAMIRHGPKQNRHYNFAQASQKLLSESLFRGDSTFAIASEFQKTNLSKAKLEMLKETDPALHSFYRSMFGEMIRNFYGTKMPKLWLHSYSGTTTGPGIDVTSTTGVMSMVVNLSAATLAGFGAWATLFDEYRPTGPFVIKYKPRIVPATGYPTSSTSSNNGMAYGLGLLDYVDNSTAISNIALAVMADTHKVFPLTGYVDHITEWHGHVLGIPDESWLNVTSLGTVWASWKAMQAQNVYGVGTIYWGYVSYAIEIEFRQLTGT